MANVSNRPLTRYDTYRIFTSVICQGGLADHGPQVLISSIALRMPERTKFRVFSWEATHVEALELDRLPRHLIVLGGGYVGLKFAQAYCRFGSRVTVVEHGPQPAGDEG